MGSSNWFVRRIGHPLWLVYKGQSGILTWQRRLGTLYSADNQVLDEWRLVRLKKLLRHAAATSLYYRDLFESKGFGVDEFENLSQLQELPFLTKDILNLRMKEVLSTSFSRDKLIESSTGGSSGTPLTFYRDSSAMMVRRSQDYFFNAKIGIYPGTRRAWVWGSPVDAFSLGKLKARIANFLTERAIYLYSFDANRNQIKEFVQELHSHRPRVVFAYPNMLAEIAQTVTDLGLAPPRIEKVVVTAEPLYDWQRELFAEVFGSETHERYGSREIGTVASEITAGGGMTICEPGYILEVIDSDGNTITSGSSGELVVTDLFNYAMPLIRYRTGDMVRIADAKTDSGSNWRRIVEVGGRIVDMILRSDGSWVAGEVLIMALRTAGVRTKVQVVQETPHKIKLIHLHDEPLRAEILNRFKDKVREILRGDVDVSIETVSNLPYDKSGKYRYVTSSCRKDARGKK